MENSDNQKDEKIEVSSDDFEKLDLSNHTHTSACYVSKWKKQESNPCPLLSRKKLSKTSLEEHNTNECDSDFSEKSKSTDVISSACSENNTNNSPIPETKNELLPPLKSTNFIEMEEKAESFDENTSEELSHICFYCETTFARYTSLTKHLRKKVCKEEFVHKIRSTKCPICSLHILKSKFKHHISSVHENKTNSASVDVREKQRKKYTCSICGSELSSTTALNYHILSVHQKQKPFPCSICKGKFTTQQSLEKHISSVHEGKRPYLCSVCAYASSQSWHLKKHIALVHEGKRPFACFICNNTYQSKDAMQRHISRDHEGKKPFKCSQCDRKFSGKQCLKKHSLNVHTNIRPYKCPACEAAFKRKNTLDNHLKTIHGLVE